MCVYVSVCVCVCLSVWSMGAQITLLRGSASVPHPLLLRNEASPYLLSGELCTSPLHSNRL